MGYQQNRYFLSNLCKYCINNYQILNNGPILSSFIYQVCKEIDLDVPVVRGILGIEVNGIKREFAHCFNLYNGDIIDATVYQYALMYKSLQYKLPLYVSGNTSDKIEYEIGKELKYSEQVKFDKLILQRVVNSIKTTNINEPEYFNEIDDSKKKSLFSVNRF